MKVLRSKYENANYKYLFYALKNARIPDTGYNRHFKWLKEVIRGKEKRGTNGCTAFFGGDGWRLQLDIGENNILVQ